MNCSRTGSVVLKSFPLSFSVSFSDKYIVVTVQIQQMYGNVFEKLKGYNAVTLAIIHKPVTSNSRSTVRALFVVTT